jgi:cell division initiation protein
MTLSPEDIQSKQFHVRFRGFDVEEVDSFLEQVAENVLMLIEENKTLRVRIETMTQDLEIFKKDETSFKNAIVSAQKVADEMKKKSRSDANRLMMQASAEVTQLKDEANREIAALESRVDALKGMQSRLMADLRGVLNGYLDQLEDSALNSGEIRAYERGNVETKMSQPAAKRADFDQPPLYEKITVDDDDDLWQEQAEADREPPAVDRHESHFSGPTIGGLDLDEEEEPSVAIPDMDDDVMFTLDDPLDQESGRKKW